MTERDPLPFPKLQNDDNFLGKGKSLDFKRSLSSSSGEKDPNLLFGGSEALKLSPGEDAPWDRLAYSKTLSSYRREAFYYDPISPNDSLDFALRVEYDQHKDCLHSKAQSVVQPETVRTDHGRVLKNRPVVTEPVTLEKKQLVSHEVGPRKTTLDCAKGLSIESHHSEATNRGYSRKKDGGFYCT